MQAAANPAIAADYLAEGVLLLRNPNRRAASETAGGWLASREQREPARVITMAWGERYVDDLVEITIPALLAPGNLPAFAETFACEFVIVTETRLFDRLTGSAAVAGVLNFVDVRLVPIDDLLSPWYGITLTYALVRGFADLGAAMTQTHLVFLNADFILADGSYRKLAEIIKRGERLVVSPSYCMNLEDTIEVLRRRRDQASAALVLSHRELARIIIANRHNTIRAKTVNQRMFRIHRYDQFYWYVDEETLLCRQMPIAVVYMRPERALTEMPTFWDYGVIREYCPTTVPCVLGDSDDFLMAELRSRGTFRELFHLGWPTVDEIAADLSSFTTRDHRDYGRHTLVLHAGELPPDLGAAGTKLAAFVDRVYERLKPPIDHRDHPFWAPQFPRFITHQRQAYHARRTKEAAAARLIARDPRAAWRQRQIEALTARLPTLAGEIRVVQQRLSQIRQMEESRQSALTAEFRLKQATLEREIEGLSATDRAAAARLRTTLAILERRASKLRQQQGRAEEQRRAAVRAHNSELAPRAETEADSGTRGYWRGLRANAVRKGIGWCAGGYRRAFGSLPRTTSFHPYHTMLQPVLRALERPPRAAHVLVISSGGELAADISRVLDGEKFVVTPGLIDADFCKRSFAGRPKFDLCFCDLAADDLVKFRQMLDLIRPFLTSGSRVVVTYHNLAGRAIDQWTFEFAVGLFPLVGHSKITLAGSYPGALSVRWFTHSLRRHNVGTPAGLVALAATLAVCAPLARLGSWFEQRRNPQGLPRRCTNMTIVIDLPRVSDDIAIAVPNG